MVHENKKIEGNYLQNQENKAQNRIQIEDRAPNTQRGITDIARATNELSH